MKRLMAAAVMLCVVLMLTEVAPGAAQASAQKGGLTRSRAGRSWHARSRRWGRARRSGRPVARPAGVTLPQLRTELSRLETGLGAHVQRIEKAAVRPPQPRVVLAAPAAPPPHPAPPPASPALAAALCGGITGTIGFALGRWSAQRAPVRALTEPAPEPSADKAVEESAPSRLQRQLEEAQQRLSHARNRIRQLERGA